MNIFQIPKISDAGTDMIIGVIDCSSSMESNWPWLADHWNRYVTAEHCLTITFDSIASIIPDNILSSNINIHGGGGTNITAGFELMEKEIDKLTEKRNITVIFVSDGADNRMTTLEKRMASLKDNHKNHHINFICLGVGAEFPTFIALKLREKYHNGDETLPAIFLIEYVTEKAYTIKFEALKKYFGFNMARKVTPAVCLFPWREYTEAPYETAWILTDSDKLIIDGEEFSVGEYHLNVKGIHELFRSWAQMMHLESLKEGEKIQNRAKKTLEVMTMILEALKDVKGLDFLSGEDPKIEGKTLYDRIIYSRIRRDATRIRWFYNDVKSLAEGKYVINEGQFEAAKRIGMGTIVGIFQQKVAALKITTVTEFNKIKDEFKALLKKYPVQERLSSIGIVKGVQYKTLRDVLREKTLEKALDLCQNQFDLFEAFELNGLPIRITRDKINLTKPFELDIKFIDPTKIVTSSDVWNSKSAYTIKCNGNNEFVNAVLPLLDEDSHDLIPFLESRLFRLIMTYNCFQEADRILDDAYLATLAGSIQSLMRSDADKEIKTTILTSMGHTSNYLRSVLPEYHYLQITAPLDLTSLLFKKTSPFASSTRANLGEILMKMLSYWSNNKLEYPAFKQLSKIVIASQFFDCIRNDKSKTSNAFEFVLGDTSDGVKCKEIILERMKYFYTQCFTRGELRRALRTEICNLLKDKDFGTKFNPSKIDRVVNNKNAFNELLGFIDACIGWQPVPEQLENMLVLAFSSYSENGLAGTTPEVLASSRKNIDTLIKQQNNHTIKNKKIKKSIGSKIQVTPSDLKNLNWSPLYNMLVNKTMLGFEEYFKNTHYMVYPLSQSEIKSFATSLNLSNSNIRLNKESHLPINCCAAPSCPFFLKVTNKRISHHMKIWGDQIPSGFHALVKENRKKSTESIFYTVLYSCGIDSNVTENKLIFGRPKKEVLEYISKLQAAYDKILS